MSFINKVILVTGAGSGIGEAISLLFAKLSGRLSLVDVDPKNLQKTADACEQISRVKVLSTVVNLCNDVHVKRAIDNTVKEFGRIDIVINCVGIYKPGNIQDSDLIDVFDTVFTTNLRSVVYLTNLVVPLLTKSKGCIINISSATSTNESIPYSVTIAGLNHFTKCIALELADKGIRVNCILPGIVKTKTLNDSKKLEENGEHRKTSSAPLNRNVKYEGVAELAAFLASDKSKAMTGCCYPINAGLA